MNTMPVIFMPCSLPTNTLRAVAASGGRSSLGKQLYTDSGNNEIPAPVSMMNCISGISGCSSA